MEQQESRLDQEVTDLKLRGLLLDFTVTKTATAAKLNRSAAYELWLAIRDCFMRWSGPSFVTQPTSL